MGQTDQAGALDGIRVLDLSRILAGPWCTQILGDLGADVVKVESPKGGDDTRTWGPPFMTAADGARRDAAYFACCNRNKRSLAIDFATPEGAAQVRKLAAKADILVENFKRGGLRKYGLDYESLRQVNPKMIYCSITGFGQDGPYADRPGYDFLIQGMGGLMSITGAPDQAPGGEPTKVGVAVCDLFTGMNAVCAILAALNHRHASGEGQHIDCALLDSQVAMLANQASNWLNGGVEPGRLGNSHPNVVPYRVYQTKDGHVIVSCGNDRQFARLCAALGRPELADDPRFASNEARIHNRALIDSLLSDALTKLEKQEVIDRLEAAGVPCGPINSIPDVYADPHVQARALEVQQEAADGSLFRTSAFPAKLSRTPARYRRTPPGLGEHSKDVLEDWGVDP
ncbi:MAG: CaiB/BaiF CoA-transferase family protein [Pseudomonadota bacterium]